MKKIIALLLSLLIFILSLTSCVVTITSPDSNNDYKNEEEEEKKDFYKTGRYTKENEEFVIGFSGPLTGAAKVYGIAVMNAAQMAVDEINATGGIDGVKFKLVATDDKHDPANISTNFSSMLEDGMQVSLGTVTTAPGLE